MEETARYLTPEDVPGVVPGAAQRLGLGDVARDPVPSAGEQGGKWKGSFL